ncbi:SRPBCC family protein [Nakamurella endophytica]|uniref:SRPBCC family protein n=1 Tax=Nakamurella endophytica TaxID=1748367 RepID=A0A917WCY2_9ACTN|nr:SRPBCC family protein [Nakamurella endophytica]GGL95862.1 hypothetical protein GCM10011594_14460 [Nakamurella endophytica]
MKARLEVGLDIAAPVESVFQAMVDLPSQERWMLLTRLYPLAGDAPVPAVGSRLAALTGIGGMGVLDTMQVTVFDPPRRWETRHDGGLIKGRGIFEVRPAAAGARAVWIEDLELPLGLLGGIGWLVLRPAFRWGLGRSLRTLAAGVTGGTLPLRPEHRPAGTTDPGATGTTGTGAGSTGSDGSAAGTGVAGAPGTATGDGSEASGSEAVR